MNKGQRQHFVPEVYLKNFCFDEIGNLFELKVKENFGKLNIKVKNKSQICYALDNYKVSDPDLAKKSFDNDQNFIENEMFKYENEFISWISKKVNNQDDLNKNDITKLVRVLLSFKHRNVNLKKTFQGSKIMGKQIEKSIKDMKVNTLSYREVNPELYKELIRQLEIGLRDNYQNKSYMSDLYLSQLKRSEERSNPNHERLVSYLSSSKLTVLNSTDDIPFISSDNPGFSLHPGGLVEHLYFGTAVSFSFPLTKNRFLHFDLSLKNDGKKLQYKNVSASIIDQFNRRTIEMSEKRIFSDSKKYLEYVLKKFNFQIMDFT